MDAAHADVITDVAYNWYGSRLAVASADHSVSIWQNSGGTWTLHKRFVAHSAPVRSAAWAAPELGELLATAGDRTVKIWQKDPSKELFRITLNAAAIQVKWAPPAFALKIAAVDASGAITIAECLDPHSQVWDIVTLNSIDHSLRIALDWAGEAHMFVVACDLYAKIYFFDNKWKVKETIQHSSVLTCVAWAPSMGRSFHLIATAALDGHVRIFKLKPDIANGTSLITKMIADFPDHKSEVSKIQWNVTGTVLSSSGDDGRICLWKATYLDDWKLVSVICPETYSNAMMPLDR